MFIQIGVMLQAAQLIICHSKSKNFENFWTAIPRNKRNMFIAILLSFFITYFTSFILRLAKLNTSRDIFRALDLRCSFWRQQLTVPEVDSEQGQTRKMKLSEKNIFSCPLFQPFTIYTKKLHLRCSTLFWIRFWNH